MPWARTALRWACATLLMAGGLVACSHAPSLPVPRPPLPQVPTPPPTPPQGPAAPSAAQHPPSAPTPKAPAATGAVGVPAVPAPPSAPNPNQPPPEPREFRAAWVATVANIDWPSAPGLSSERQKSEALAILNKAQALGLNALILQVRPAGDAIYPSALEPWSEWLTGASGRAPEPAYDPLAFWVQQAHQRGLELHAWFNPYRARAASKTLTAPLVAPHLAVLRPELAKRYGDLLWLDPGEAAAAAHTLAVVADVVRRYNVDGVHIDDYFYPYPVSVDGVEQPFPDDESYARYRLGGGALPRADWRRSNVDQLVQQLHSSVHAIKPWVRLGISPFGLGRPDRRPAALGPGSGFSQYDKLYADVERWLEKGWLDYLAPQLYWPIDRAGLQFPVLLNYWAAQNPAQRHLWPGLYTSLVGKTETGAAPNPRVWPAREVLDQIGLVRKFDAAASVNVGVNSGVIQGAYTVVNANAGASGHIHFSMAALMQDRDGLATQLKAGLYAQPALVPATPWLGSAAPSAPRWVRGGANLAPASVGNTVSTTPTERLALHAGPGEPPLRFAVWRRVAGQWRLAVVAAQNPTVVDAEGADLVVASAVSRTGVTGPRASQELPTAANAAALIRPPVKPTP